MQPITSEMYMDDNRLGYDSGPDDHTAVVPISLPH